MSLHSIHTTVRLHRGSLIIALGIAVAACGGGGDDGAGASAFSPAIADQHATERLSVMVEGCVLDGFYIPTTGTPVRALSADGRLPGSALSGGHGRFTLRLPARSEVMLQIDRPQGESLPMRVGATPSKWGTCLLDERA
jgi:hypothetical protein